MALVRGLTVDPTFEMFTRSNCSIYRRPIHHEGLRWSTVAYAIAYYVTPLHSFSKC